MPIVSTPGQVRNSAQGSLPADSNTTINPPVSSPPAMPIAQQDSPVTIPVQTPVMQSNAPMLAQNPLSRVQNMVPKMQSVAQPPQPSLDDDGDFSLEDFDIDESDDLPSTLPSFSPNNTKSSSPIKGQSLSRMTEDERRRVITETFLLVLGKEASDRDFSYYRFSTLTEESLVKSLLTLPEHKQLVEKAREHASLKQSMNDLDIRTKQMEASLASMQQELYTLQQLLIEKNRYIQQMRGIPEERMAQPLPQQQFVQPEVAQTIETVQTTSSLGVEVKKLPGPLDEMKSMMKSLFGGKR